MIGQPPPGVGAHPGVAQPVVPEPVAALEWRPAIEEPGLPHGADVSLQPFAGRVEIGQPEALRHVMHTGGRGEHLIALFAPAIEIHRGDLAVEREAGGVARLDANGLSFAQIDFGGGAGKTHDAFDHRNAALGGAGLDAHPRAA